MSRRRRSTVSLTLGLALAALFVAQAATASTVFDCYLGYRITGNGLQLTLHPRNCVFTLLYQDPGDPYDFVSRTVACSVPLYGSHCSVTVDPVAAGIPAGYVAVAAKTAPLYSSFEEEAGCVYSIFQPAGSSELRSYPVTFFDTSTAAPTPTTANPLPYAWSDPMPGLPVSYASSDPMPATPVSGDSFHVVALHYFDCVQP